MDEALKRESWSPAEADMREELLCEVWCAWDAIGGTEPRRWSCETARPR